MLNRLVWLLVAAFCGHTKPATPAPFVSARVIGAMTSRESMMYATARLSFVNHATRPVHVTRYRITWPGGEIELPAKGLVVPASGTIGRTATIQPDDGDLDALMQHPAAATVTVVDSE